jgi:hypothetical protein
MTFEAVKNYSNKESLTWLMLWTMPHLLFYPKAKKKKIRLIYCLDERKRIKDGTKNIWKPPNFGKNVSFFIKNDKNCWNSRNFVFFLATWMYLSWLPSPHLGWNEQKKTELSNLPPQDCFYRFFQLEKKIQIKNSAFCSR